MNNAGENHASVDSVFLQNELATLSVAEDLAADLQPGLCIYLRGQLGSGKTTLTRGILRALGYSGPVKSPTYTLVETYEFARFTVNHFDLYRLNDPEELELLGVRDYFGGVNICIIEWPERGADILPPADVNFELQVAEKSRYLVYHAANDKGSTLVASLSRI